MSTEDSDHVQEQLSGYLDGELTDQQRQQVEGLLAESPQARQLLAELRQTARLVGELPRAKAPPGLAESIAAAVGTGGPPTSPSAARTIRWPLWFGGSAVAAAGILLVVGLFLYQRQPAQLPETQVADTYAPPEPGQPTADKKRAAKQEVGEALAGSLERGGPPAPAPHRYEALAQQEPTARNAGRAVPEAPKPAAAEKALARQVPPAADGVAALRGRFADQTEELGLLTEGQETRPPTAAPVPSPPPDAADRLLTLTVPDAAVGGQVAELLARWADSNRVGEFVASPLTLQALDVGEQPILSCYRLELDEEQLTRLASVTQRWEGQFRSMQTHRLERTLSSADKAAKATPLAGSGEDQPAGPTAERFYARSGVEHEMKAAVTGESARGVIHAPGKGRVTTTQPAETATGKQQVLVVIRLAAPTTQPAGRPPREGG